jgi:hypothetical protein
MSEREGGNLSAQTDNSLPYLHRLHQFPWHHSLHNRKLHQHRWDDNCFIVPTLQWALSRDALSWDIQQWDMTFRALALLQNSGHSLSWYWTYLLYIYIYIYIYLLSAHFNFPKWKNRLLRSLYYVYLYFSFRNKWLIFTKLGMTCQIEDTLIQCFSTSCNQKQQRQTQQSRRANLWDGNDTTATYVTNDTETVHSNSLHNK